MAEVDAGMADVVQLITATMEPRGGSGKARRTRGDAYAASGQEQLSGRRELGFRGLGFLEPAAKRLSAVEDAVSGQGRRWFDSGPPGVPGFWRCQEPRETRNNRVQQTSRHHNQWMEGVSMQERQENRQWQLVVVWKTQQRGWFLGRFAQGGPVAGYRGLAGVV
ncbi:hypothetical protein VTK73DRAFT_4681 [Phialemonium thermophilum]|uniref:Uncharacterized protein n=1 Tax=Phialemonium thermophilum TaxID=223376 RepID=A0ABR3V7S2_9PEZI